MLSNFRRSFVLWIIFICVQVNVRGQNYLGTIADPAHGGQFIAAAGVAMDANGNLFVGDYFTQTIQKFNSSGTWLVTFGGSGTANGKLKFLSRAVQGFAVDANGNLYVTDTGNHRIHKFDNNGNFILTFGSNGTGDGQFNYPTGIAIDSHGDIYVGDQSNYRIQKFSASGTFILSFAAPAGSVGQFIPSGMAIDANNNLYVGDIKNGRIVKFDNSQNVVATFGSPGSGDGQLYGNEFGVAIDPATNNIFVSQPEYPRISQFASDGSFVKRFLISQITLQQSGNLIIDGNSQLYVVDGFRACSPCAMNNAVIKSSKTGSFMKKIGTQASDLGQFMTYGHNGMAVDKSGNLYVTDEYNHRVQKFDAAGRPLLQWGKFGRNAGEFFHPIAIAVDKDDNVYVADSFNSRIQKFTSKGELIFQFGSYGEDVPGLLFYAQAVAVDADGFIYVLEGDKHISKFTSAGLFVTRWGGIGTGDAKFSYGGYGLAVDIDKNVYVSDASRVQKFTSSGTFIKSYTTNTPSDLFVDASGNLYVASNYGVEIFDASGVSLLQWGSTKGSGNYEFGGRTNITLDGVNNILYVGDGQNARIQKYAGLNGTVPLLAPTITNINPTSGTAGSTVTITGTNFNSIAPYNTVKINGANANVVSATSTSLTITVPPAASSGNINVSTGEKSVTSAGLFTVIPTLLITDFSPRSGLFGTTITISGKNFDPVAANNVVKFNGVAATVSAATSTSLDVVVPSNATTGKIAVSAGGQDVTTVDDFTIVFQPTISSVNPEFGIVGTSVTITGTNFSTVTQNNQVKFNGIIATITQASATSLTLTVPSGATTGKVSVAVGSLSVETANNFKVIVPPVITGFTPTSGATGTSITISGSNFDLIAANNEVKFNGVSAVVSSSTANSLVVTVPAGALTGPISASILGYGNSSSSNFIVAPTITSFTPTSGEAGTIVKISGLNFSAVGSENAVKFNGVNAVVNAASSTELTVVVPATSSGKISVTVGGQTATSDNAFLLSPVITSFSPAGGDIGTTVTINGANFSPAAAENIVKFNGIAANVTAASSNSITAVVPANATVGPISVSVLGVEKSSSSNFIVSPRITTFSPKIGRAGTVVTIDGVNFDPVPASNIVKFNGATASVNSATKTKLVVVVPTSTTGKISVTSNGQTGTSVDDFVIDATPPNVSANNTAGSTKIGTSVGVSVNIDDPESGVAAAYVRYRAIAQGSTGKFLTSVLVKGSGNTYTATIAGSAVTELGVEYKIQAINGVGQWNSDSLKLFTSRIAYDEGLDIVSYPSSAAGSAKTNYRMISIPLTVTAGNTADKIFAALGPYDKSKWRIFSYDANSFQELTGSSPVTPGKGYWFIAKSVSKPLNTGAGTTVEVNTGSPFKIQLKPGWNLIGNPYPFSISWADILAANPGVNPSINNNRNLVTFNGAKVEGSTKLGPFEGGFVKNTGADVIDLIIPVTLNKSIQNGRVALHESSGRLDSDGWEIPLVLRVGDVENTLGGIGMHPEAHELFDKYDDFVPPHAADYADIVFDKKLRNFTYTKDVVPTATNYVWEFSVSSDAEGTASLRWDNSAFGNGAGPDIFLLDKDNYQLTNMRTSASYVFDSNKSKGFKIIFGNPGFVANELTPDAAQLLEPFPNPMQNAVTIQYVLPNMRVGEQASIRVYNARGEHVFATDLGGMSGYGELQWSAENLPAGMYVVKLDARGRTITRKIIKK